MRFSFSATNTALDPDDDEAMIESEIRQVLLADRLGYDMVKFGERHFGGYGSANPLQFLAAVAPQLTNAWVGTGIAVAPDYHPVRLAEMINVLDHIARGKLIVGIGSGMSVADGVAFGFDSVEQKKVMLGECLDALDLLWGKAPDDPPVSFETSHYRGTLLQRISPTPWRKDRPHLKLTAGGDPNIERAARHGWPVYLGPGDAEAEAATFHRYREKLRAHGHDEEKLAHALGWTSAVTIGLHIADTDAQAEDEARWLLEGTKIWAARREQVERKAEDIQQLRPNEAQLRHIARDLDDDFWKSVVVAGSPETVARRVQGFADLGAGLFQVAFVGQTDAERRALGDKAIELFAREVIPRFKDGRAPL